MDGASDPAFTVISIRATNRPGILQLLKSTLEDLGLSVERTEVDMEKDLTSDVFYVTGDDGARVDDPYDLANIEQVLVVVLNAHYRKSSGAPRPPDGDVRRSTSGPDGMKPRQKDLLYSLMDNYIKNDVLSVQSSIVNHVEYTLGRSRYRFDDFEAYQVRATLKRVFSNLFRFRLSFSVFSLPFPTPSPMRLTPRADLVAFSLKTPRRPPRFPCVTA